MVYVGMDVHRKRTQVAIMQEDGTEMLNRNVANDPAELSPLLGTLEPGTPVVFEAAYGWGWLAELLDDWDLEAHLAHAKNCKAIASARLKNDKVDARTLAHLLRSDLLPEAWIAPREVRDLRLVLRHRASLVRSATALKNRIHGVLADRGIRCPIDDLWTKPGRAWLGTLELPPIHQEIVNDCLGLIDALAVPVGRLDREIRGARQAGCTRRGPPGDSRDRAPHGHDAGGRNRGHQSLSHGPQTVRVGRTHPDGA